MSVLERLTTRAQADIMDTLYESARANAATTNGLLVPYAPDLARFPYQSLSVRTEHISVEGTPKKPDETFRIASVVDRRCGDLEAAFIDEDSEENGEPFSCAGKILQSGQNVVFGTDHAELVDIAFFGAGTSAYLRKEGYQHESALIASKAIDYLGVNTEIFGMPEEIVRSYLDGLGLELEQDGTVTVRNFLKIAFDLQYLTIPNTQSFQDLRKLHQEAIEAHTGMLTNKIHSRMSRRGIRKKLPLALFVAMPGTKNKELDVDTYKAGDNIPGFYESYPEQIVTADNRNPEIIGRISHGITGYTEEALTFASAIRLISERKPKVRCDRNFHVLNGGVAVDLFARTLTQLIRSLDGPDVYYDNKGNLPLRR